MKRKAIKWFSCSNCGAWYPENKFKNSWCKNHEWYSYVYEAWNFCKCIQTLINTNLHGCLTYVWKICEIVVWLYMYLSKDYYTKGNSTSLVICIILYLWYSIYNTIALSGSVSFEASIIVIAAGKVLLVGSAHHQMAFTWLVWCLCVHSTPTNLFCSIK